MYWIHACLGCQEAVNKNKYELATLDHAWWYLYSIVLVLVEDDEAEDTNYLQRKGTYLIVQNSIGHICINGYKGVHLRRILHIRLVNIHLLSERRVKTNLIYIVALLWPSLISASPTHISLKGWNQINQGYFQNWYHNLGWKRLFLCEKRNYDLLSQYLVNWYIF